VRARKRFGQHFLEAAWAAKVLAAIDPQAGDVFLEIGSGTGALTFPLAARAAQVVAIEIDRDLAATLAARVPANVRVVAGDVLRTDVPALMATAAAAAAPGAPAGLVPARVAGNLPYNAAAPILFTLLDLAERHGLFSDATLMLQREVAARLASPPGGREYGVLTVLVGLRATVTRLFTLPPGAFRPVPAVVSTLVRLSFHPPAVEVDRPAFEALVRGVFQHRRKTLLNALRACWPAEAPIGPAEALAKAGLEAGRRPETLHLADLAGLAAFWRSVRA
jgi:16S rRNA (adenine1518-N6/adenine1519-N6)-dimethyltransferase